MAINPISSAYASINLGSMPNGKSIRMYIPASSQGGSESAALNACSQAMTEGGAVAYDKVANACWGVTGLVIPIGDTNAAVMKGFQYINFNFHTCGDCCPTTDKYALPGPCLA